MLNEQELTIKISTNIPDGHTVETYLRKVAVDTLYARRMAVLYGPGYDGADLAQEVDVLLKEIVWVCEMGEAGYLLAASEFAKSLRAVSEFVNPSLKTMSGIPLLSYCLDLTTTDPNESLSFSDSLL